MTKISYFWHLKKKKIPHQIHILPPRCPHEKFSGAATGYLNLEVCDFLHVYMITLYNHEVHCMQQSADK